MGTPAKVGLGCLAAVGVVAILFFGVAFTVAFIDEMQKGSGSSGSGNGSGNSSGSGYGGDATNADCIVTNFNVELCGQDAVDHCESRRRTRRRSKRTPRRWRPTLAG
jgi:hypothetical protein